MKKILNALSLLVVASSVGFGSFYLASRPKKVEVVVEHTTLVTNSPAEPEPATSTPEIQPLNPTPIVTTTPVQDSSTAVHITAAPVPTKKPTAVTAAPKPRTAVS